MQLCGVVQVWTEALTSSGLERKLAPEYALVRHICLVKGEIYIGMDRRY